MRRLRLLLDFVALLQTRVPVLIAFVSAPQPVLKPAQIHIAAIVSNRMAKAMRGA
jgi:hypothetical protein